MTHEYRTIRRFVRDRVSLDSARVLDFGCGEGIAAASFALRHPAAKVFALDIVPPDFGLLRQKLADQTSLELPTNLALFCGDPGTLPEEICDLDLIFAWSVFEHVNFSQLTETMRLLRGRLGVGGALLIQINPLFFSPRGSHLYRYDASPWVHLLCQADALKTVVMNSSWPEKVKLREWAQFESLNRATGGDIKDAAGNAGLSIVLEEQLRIAETPPPRLLRVYHEDVLMTEEIRLLLI